MERTHEEQAIWDECARNAKGKLGKEWYDAFLPAWQKIFGPKWQAEIDRQLAAGEIEIVDGIIRHIEQPEK